MGIKSDLMKIQLSNYELTRIVVGERLMLNRIQRYLNFKRTK